MKKLSTATDLGGAPIYKNDLREVFNYEIWAAVEALMSQFNSDTQGIVVQGCVTTANGGNFDMTSGVVYINGEFMRIPAATNQAFTKYIAPAAVVNSTRTFADTTSHVVTIDSKAELVSSAPGTGQYITISSLTSLDARRWRPALNQDLNTEIALRSAQNPNGLVTDYIDIGDWDMDTDATKTISAATLSSAGIVDLHLKKHWITVTIVADSDAGIVALNGSSLLNEGAGEFTVNGTDSPGSLTLQRTNGAEFDSTNYNMTSYNRGYILITYLP